MTKKDLQQITNILIGDEYTNHLKSIFVTKEEFITRFDTVINELKGIREEITILAHHSQEYYDQLENHEHRLRTCEQKLA
ncbi:MAG TPA: hypothetical protein VD999_01265 [Vitreimonas sp.]|nr:hypothetical protein [Vitreimonas sp.]